MALNQIQPGPQQLSDGIISTARGGKTGETIISALHGRYFEAVSRKSVFTTQAILTAPVIYTTAAATGGPLLWNGTQTVYGNLLKVGFSSSVVTTVAGSLGITGGTGQTVIPTSLTASDGTTNCYLGGPLPQINTARLATVATAGTWFVPLMQFHTGALTVQSTTVTWVDVDGLFLFGPNSWVSVAASATLTTLQVRVALIWEEIPIAAVAA